MSGSVSEQLRELLEAEEHWSHQKDSPVKVSRGLLRSAVIMLEAFENRR